jgi:hypothetical protein
MTRMTNWTWLLALAATLVLPTGSAAQRVFHSTQSANLHTATMLRSGSWLFEISHRFVPPMSTGAEGLWGADGPAFIRFGLTYQATDRLSLQLMRTNLDDNVEVDAKLGLASMDLEAVTLELAAAGGVAVNTQVVEVDDPAQDQLREDNEIQLYAQLLINALLGERIAVGVAPSYLRNPRLLDVKSEDALALGLHAQVYLSDAMSLLGEWIVSENIPSQAYDSGTLGIELETRGHFFKLLVTNQTRPNPTQYLGGAPNPFFNDDETEGVFDELRFGFNITRLLPF